MVEVTFVENKDIVVLLTTKLYVKEGDMLRECGASLAEQFVGPMVQKA